MAIGQMIAQLVNNYSLQTSQQKLEMTISGRQVAAARGLLNWSQGHLAEAAGVGLQTIVRWEQGIAEPRRDTTEKVRQAIEDRGVEFTNGGQPGVRYKAKPGSAMEHESAGE